MNLWKKFRDLLPSDPLQVGKVIAHNDDGTSTVELPGPTQIRVRGQDVDVDGYAFVQGGQIQGAAPALPTYTIAI